MDFHERRIMSGIFPRYMVDVAAYDYDFSSSLADGTVGFSLVLSQQPEVRRTAEYSNSVTWLWSIESNCRMYHVRMYCILFMFFRCGNQVNEYYN